jgi:gluconokinase
LIFLPYLTGERAPIWDSESCGTFFGVKLQHSLLHFSRAVLEGICFAMKDVLEAVQQNADPITQINIGGGFVNSDLWVQVLADITGKNLVIAQSEDASAVGAAYLAMKTLNLIKEYPTLDMSKLKIITPDPEKFGSYEKQFEMYKSLYQDLKDTMHKHYELFS